MSGRGQSKDVPVAFKQKEVDALTAGGKAAANVRRRLRDVPPAKRKSSKPRVEKAFPQPISKQEMAVILKRGVPASVRKRIDSSSPAPAEAEAYSAPTKEIPTATPGKPK